MDSTNKILITGGSGLIGSRLSEMLREKGYEVVLLSQRKSMQATVYTWEIDKQQLPLEALQGVSYIVHLAGANVGEKRWSAKRKKEIEDSRVLSTRLLFDTIKKNNSPIKAVIAASATGFYGIENSTKIFTEEDSAEKDFLSTVCEKWEHEINRFQTELNIRTVTLRTSVVLAKQGGAFAKFKTPASLFSTIVFGNGQQPFPWIHLDDICRLYLYAIENENLRGLYNASAPSFITQKEFSTELTTALSKPIFSFSIPPVILRIMLGEMSEMLLGGATISVEKIQRAGFHFLYPTLREALQELCKKD